MPPAAPSATASGRSQAVSLLLAVQDFLLRKIWLPKLVYSLLPWLYLLLSVAAAVSALFLEHWSWIVPYMLLLGIGCLHAAVLILTLRWRYARRKSVPE